MNEVFKKLGITTPYPILLAPLAGVSDHPFRRICARLGADLTYVEMLSSTALLRHSPRTLDMMQRHESEQRLGVQVTGSIPEDIAKAVGMLDKGPFDTIDINMGCPVRKVVSQGCGSALLKDVEKVYRLVKLSREETDKPFSVKIRIGWDRNSVNAFEIAQAIQEGGADWLTVHGRCRSDDYQTPVDLECIRGIVERVEIPVIGNGNIFTREDADHMLLQTGVQGVMVSRGALGNPWVFLQYKDEAFSAPTLDDWFALVQRHLRWQHEAYGDKPVGALCMRKHLLWYTKGWPGSKKIREHMNTMDSIPAIEQLLEGFVGELKAQAIEERDAVTTGINKSRFHWEPKWDMHRQYDRGVDE